MFYAVVEGPDYGGKSSAIEQIDAMLALPHQVIREPGGTSFGENIRSLVLEQQTESTRLSRSEELVLMSAQRSYLHRKLIRPALDEGKVVIGDRGEASSYAYQGSHYNDNLFMAIRDDMQLLTPDAFFLLDIDYETYLHRKRAAGVVHQFHDEVDRNQFEYRRRRYFEYIDRFMIRDVNAFVIETSHRTTPADIAKIICSVIEAGVRAKTN